jgi:peptide/nickel transport system substrate-binding protein
VDEVDSLQPHESVGLQALGEAASAERIDRRVFFRRAAALGLSSAAAAAFLAACSNSRPAGSSGTTSNAPGHAGTLAIGPIGDSGNYDPATNNWDAPYPPFPSIYEGLTTYVPTQGWTPRDLLAESLERSADGKTYAFTLKQGIQFHHGFGELTAADVKYSFERCAGIQKLYPGAPKSAVSYYAGDMPGLREVKVTARYSGQIIFDEPFTPFDTITLPFATSGLILSEKAVAKYRASWPVHPIGTGPYEVASYTPNSEMVLQRFAEYGHADAALGASSDFDEIKMVLAPLNSLPKGEALTVALQSGEVDFTPNLGPLDIARLKGDSSYRTYEPPIPLTYFFLALDVLNPKLKDVRVRQAVRAALDIPEIIKANQLPLSTRLNSVIAKQMEQGYWAGAPQYTRDVAKAKSLLAAAGASNLTLEIATPEITTLGGSPNDVMQVIQSNLSDAGITVNIIETPPDSYVTKAGFGSLVWNAYNGAPDPYYQLEWFTCNQIGVWNYASWCNQKYSSLEQSLGRTSDVATRDAICIQMQQLVDEAVSYVWISTAIGYSASTSNIQAVFDGGGYFLPNYFRAV